MAPTTGAFSSWKELKSKFVAAAKRWQTQKRRTKEAQTKSAQAHRVWTAHCMGKDARKQEMDASGQELMEAFPNADLAKLTPFLEDDSHSSEEYSTDD